MTFGSERLGPYLAALGATVRRDALVKAAILFFVVGGAVSAVLGAVDGAPAWLKDRSGFLGELVLLVLVMVALLRGSGEIEGREERAFWRRITCAYSAWLTGSALRFVPDLPGSLPHRPFQVACYAFLYIFMIRAVEGEPHRPVRPMKSAAERLLTLPAVTIFVLGLVIYFVFIPVSVHWQGLLEGSYDEVGNLKDEFYLYTLLDLYLSFRFLFLARTAHSRRWCSIYFTLALPWIALVLLADLSVIASETGLLWPFEGLSLWWMCAPIVFQATAVRLRHHPFFVSWKPNELNSPVRKSDGLSFVVSARTLALGVILPVIHIVVTRREMVDTPGHDARQVLVLLWLAFFGAIALVQHRHLERRAQELWLERVGFEEALRASEKDLRLIIEKDRASEMLFSAEKKFDLVFSSCPYTLVITSLEDGRFIEVNPAFEETFGYARAEVVGRPVTAVGLWIEPDAMDRLADRVRSERSIREVEIPVRRRGGEERVALVSATEIRAGGEACLLSIVHDVTERHRADKRLEAAADVLDRAAAAIFEIGADGRVRSWNRGAERLSGWTAEEALGRPAAELVGSAAAAWSGDEERGVWVGEVELVRRRGEPVHLIGWRTPIVGSAGASLMIAGEA